MPQKLDWAAYEQSLRDDNATVIDLGDGTEITIDPPQLWPARIPTGGDRMYRAIMGDEAVDKFVGAGHSLRTLDFYLQRYADEVKQGVGVALDWKAVEQRLLDERGLEIEMPKGKPIVVPPPELWGDDIKPGTDDEMLKQVMGAKDYQRFIDAGFHVQAVTDYFRKLNEGLTAGE